MGVDSRGIMVRRTMSFALLVDRLSRVIRWRKR